MTATDADLLALKTIPVPLEVSRVQGCTCGGLTWHRENCGIFDLPVEEATEAIEAAHQRLADHTAELNQRLTTLLAAVSGPGTST